MVGPISKRKPIVTDGGTKRALIYLGRSQAGGLALSCMNGGQVEVVAGINLPMLIKLASVREAESLGDAVLHAQEAGRKYINVASRVLAGK